MNATNKRYLEIADKLQKAYENLHRACLASIVASKEFVEALDKLRAAEALSRLPRGESEE